SLQRSRKFQAPRGALRDSRELETCSFAAACLAMRTSRERWLDTFKPAFARPDRFLVTCLSFSLTRRAKFSQTGVAGGRWKVLLELCWPADLAGLTMVTFGGYLESYRRRRSGFDSVA